MAQEPTILVVDDDPKIVSLIALYLERDGFRVVTATSGSQAQEHVRQHRPALVVLDVMLPDASGFDICERLREKGDVAIVMLTAKATEEDKLAGLALGADDYMVKPFSPRELVARVRAVLRRSGKVEERLPRLALHGVELERDRHAVRVDGNPVSLTAFEFKLLSTLMEFPGRVFSREELLTRIYPTETPFVVDRTIDVHIGKLRQKIEADAARPKRLLTIRGVGYKFREAGREEWVG